VRSVVEQTIAVEEQGEPERPGDATRAAGAGGAALEARREIQAGDADTAAGPRREDRGPSAAVPVARRGLRRPAASPWVRAALLALGGVLLAVGVAGLVLPGIQGLLTIATGLVVVSLASRTAHRSLRRGLRRWPKVLDAYEGMRRRLRRRFRRRRRQSSP
jgi:hypothetical protein